MVVATAFVVITVIKIDGHEQLAVRVVCRIGHEVRGVLFHWPPARSAAWHIGVFDTFDAVVQIQAFRFRKRLEEIGRETVNSGVDLVFFSQRFQFAFPFFVLNTLDKEISDKTSVVLFGDTGVSHYVFL